MLSILRLFDYKIFFNLLIYQPLIMTHNIPYTLDTTPTVFTIVA